MMKSEHAALLQGHKIIGQASSTEVKVENPWGKPAYCTTTPPTQVLNSRHSRDICTDMNCYNLREKRKLNKKQKSYRRPLSNPTNMNFYPPPCTTKSNR